MQCQTYDRLRGQRGPCGRRSVLNARELDRRQEQLLERSDDSDPADEQRLSGLRDLVGDLTDEQLRRRVRDDLAAVGGRYEGLGAADKQGFWTNCSVWNSYIETFGRG